jgi:hypothetical protein
MHGKSIPVSHGNAYFTNIIRDEQSFKRIQTYINENPAKWTDDVFYNF